MKDRIKVYIEKDAFERFILNGKSFENLLAIFCEHSVFYINMTEDDINKEWQTPSLNGQRGGSIIQKFFTGHSLKRPLSASSDFALFLGDNQNLIKYSRSLFVLNVSPQEANEMRNKYGVMVLSKDALSDDIFQFQLKDTVKKDETKSGYHDGWDAFFALMKHPMLPSNALIFSDEYLFKNEKDNVNLGVRNLKSIISHLLPDKLEVDFQILVVSPIPKDNIEKAKKISKDLTNFVHSLSVPYPCKITFVFTKTATHARKAFSNYYVMSCDKGFCVYCDKPHNRVYDTNFVDVTSIFHSAADSAGTNGYDDSSMCLAELKTCCKVAREQAQTDTITTVLILGDCGPNFEISNRLLDI